jgi:cAMP-dependent protein kinase regulator
VQKLLVHGIKNQTSSQELLPKTMKLRPSKQYKRTYRIQKRLLESFLFNALDDKEFAVVVDAMEEKKAQPGDMIIKEGDDGDNLYVVEEGELKCTKVFKGNTEPTYLKDYKPGEAFGELALLYNAPRAATITANTNATLWSLDRNTFNHIVKDAAAKKRDRYDDFLKGVRILAEMEPYERQKLADAIKTEKYAEGDHIIKQGEKGDVFYFISEGTAKATKVFHEGSEPVEVMKYNKGDYFGELALLRNEPRAANVIATVRTKVNDV